MCSSKVELDALAIDPYDDKACLDSCFGDLLWIDIEYHADHLVCLGVTINDADAIGRRPFENAGHLAKDGAVMIVRDGRCHNQRCAVKNTAVIGIHRCRCRLGCWLDNKGCGLLNG